MDPLRPQARLICPELLVVRGLERLLERLGEITRVVDEWVAVAIGHAEIVRELVRADIVTAPKLGRVHPELARQAIHDPIHREHGLGPAGAAVRRA